MPSVLVLLLHIQPPVMARRRQVGKEAEGHEEERLQSDADVCDQRGTCSSVRSLKDSRRRCLLISTSGTKSFSVPKNAFWKNEGFFFTLVGFYRS